MRRQAPVGPYFTPAQLPGLVLWLRADLGITYVQGPVVATGTTPPTVTLSGTPTSATNTIEIDITGIGILGVALFSWKWNGVVQQTAQVTAASFPLAGTGITASFGAGTYAANDVYTSVVTVSAWADQSGNGNNASQAALISQPAYQVNGGANNTPYLAHGGFAWLTAPLITTQSANFTMFTVAQASSLITRNDVFEVGNTGNNYGLFVNLDGSRRTNVNGASSAKFGTATTNWEKWCWYDTSGVNNTTRVNGVPITASGNVAITTPAGVTNIGTFSSGSPDVWSGGIAEILFYSTTLSIAQILQVEAYLLTRYGV